MLNNLLGDLFDNGDDKLPDFPIRHYSAFGNFAQDFKKQGWIPEHWNDEYTEYKPTYGLLKSIELNDGKGSKGYFSIKGGKNGVFDINIKDSQGKFIKNLKQGVSANDVNNYFTNSTDKDDYGNQIGSVINQRVNDLKKTNQQDLKTSDIGLMGSLIN